MNFTCSRKLGSWWEISRSSLRHTWHPQPLWPREVPWLRARVVVEGTQERCLSLPHHHRSPQRQKPAHTGCKHTAKVNFSNPALGSETVQNSTVPEISFPAYKPGSRCAGSEEKGMLAPKTYKFSWITGWLCYSLSKQMLYSCCA